MAATATPPLPLQRRAETRIFNMVTPLLDRHVAEGRGDRPAIRLDEAMISYADLQRLANRAGNALKAAGVEQEQRVGLLLPDGPTFVAAFLGAMKIGAVPVPMNTLAPLEDLRHYVEDSRARVLVSTAALAAPVLGLGPNPAMLKAVLLDGEGAADTGHPLARSWQDAIAVRSDDLETFPTGVDEPCYWLYSSGTTGRPKGTVHLHGDMLACVAPYAEEVVGITPDDVTFSVARLFFSYGLVNSLFLPLLAGASVALTAERPDPARVLHVTRRHKPTLLFSVPTGYAQLSQALEDGENHDQPFNCVRLAISAGEQLPAPLYQRWKDATGIELLDGVGSTEVGYIFCSNRPGQVRPGSSGRPIGGHVMRVVDESGQDCAPDEPGELWVNAESTALHYWNQRARSKATFAGEWIRTGDRYRRDADGYFWYLGRVGNVFKVSGQWVSPVDVESCLLEYPGVQECAVVGEDDGSGLLKPKAYVVLKPGATVTQAHLQAHVKAHLQPHMYPRSVVFVDQLPKTATGKVQRFKLRGEG